MSDTATPAPGAAPPPPQARLDARTEFHALGVQEQRLSAELEGTMDLGQRAQIYTLVEQVFARRAELRAQMGGRRRQIRIDQERYTAGADACEHAARVERARARLARRGCGLPDPTGPFQITLCPGLSGFLAGLYDTVADHLDR